jgi:hypothetical protein
MHLQFLLSIMAHELLSNSNARGVAPIAAAGFSFISSIAFLLLFLNFAREKTYIFSSLIGLVFPAFATLKAVDSRPLAEQFSFWYAHNFSGLAFTDQVISIAW